MTEKAKTDWLYECGYGPKVMKRIKACPSCGTLVGKICSTCPECGMRLLTKTLYDRYRERHLCCNKCGTVLPSDSRFCPHCGKALYLDVVGDERELLSRDFTLYGDEGFDLEAWLSDGWAGVIDTSLAGIGDGIDWWISTWDGSARYCLTFNSIKSGSYDGEVVLERFYGDDPTVQAQWQGWWRVETQLDQPSRLYVDMGLCNGADKAAFASSATVSKVYTALIHPSGDYILLLADDASGTLNPIFPEGVQAVELAQAVG